MAHSIDQAIELAGKVEECFVIGGGTVYAQFLPVVGKLYLTQVDESFDADTFFPEIDFQQWKAVKTEAVDAGEKNEYRHTYTEYVRI